MAYSSKAIGLVKPWGQLIAETVIKYIGVRKRVGGARRVAHPEMIGFRSDMIKVSRSLWPETIGSQRDGEKEEWAAIEAEIPPHADFVLVSQTFTPAVPYSILLFLLLRFCCSLDRYF